MSPQDAAERASEAIGRYFMGDVTLEHALTKVCDATLDASPVATMVGISMTVDARVGTYVFTHPEVSAVDQPQYDTGDGPCVEAFASGEPVVIGSTREAGPYPAFRRVAVEHGLLSVASLPMSTGSQVVGALNLYSPEERAFDERTSRQLEPFRSRPRSCC